MARAVQPLGSMLAIEWPPSTTDATAAAPNAHPWSRFPAFAAFPLAGLIVLASLLGILVPGTYGQETASWAGQALGQDWVDLLLAVPCLLVAARSALSGSRRAELVLGGILVYVFYTFVLYAFTVHFNRLFLIYCAILGVAFFALVSLGAHLVHTDVRDRYESARSVRGAAAVLMVSGATFAALWLAEIVPALIEGRSPASITDAGLFVNPVHVIDLSIILPALLGAGWSLWRGRAVGRMVGPLLLAFAALMGFSIAGMMVVMRLYGVDVSSGVAIAMAAIAAVQLDRKSVV